MRVKRRAPASCPRNQDHIEHGTIHALTRFALGGSVVFASTKSGRGAEPCLALMLLRALARLDPRWSLSSDENALTLHKSTLGGPCLLLGDKQGPSLSFSHGEGRLWAAMSSKGRVGIDVAYPEEFAGSYPFARAFRPEELDSARALCHNDTARGAALIWSAKEASVKATGAGFNRFDPLQVRVGAPLFKEQGFLFEVLADRPIFAWARTEDTGWLCVALT
jgi:hypothetical protein